MMCRLLQTRYVTERNDKNVEKLIRDAKDQPILNVAIVSDVDIILTGDKDFLSLEMEHPQCMTVTQFLENEGVEE